MKKKGCFVLALLTLCSAAWAQHEHGADHTGTPAVVPAQGDVQLGPAPSEGGILLAPQAMGLEPITRDQTKVLKRWVTGAAPSPGPEWEVDANDYIYNVRPMTRRYRSPNAAPPPGCRWYASDKPIYGLMYNAGQRRGRPCRLRPKEPIAVSKTAITIAAGVRAYDIMLVRHCGNYFVGLAGMEVELREKITTRTVVKTVPGQIQYKYIPGPERIVTVPGPERVRVVRVPVPQYPLPRVEGQYWGGPPNEKGEQTIRVERIAEFSLTWYDLVRRVRERKLPCPYCPPGQHPSPYCPIGGQPGPAPLPGTVQPHGQGHIVGPEARPSSWNGITNPPPQPVWTGENYGDFFESPFRPDSW